MNDYFTGHTADWYATFVIADADAIAAAYAQQPDAAVPTCGDWNVTQLVKHMGWVHRWATHIVEHGAAPDDTSGLRAPKEGDLGAWLIEGATAAAAAMGSVDMDADGWNPWPIPQLAGVWPRRMAQETAVHRFDARLAIDQVVPIDAELASDGIDEYFRWAVARRVAAGDAVPSGTLHVHCTDVEGEWLITPNEADDAAGAGPAGVTVAREHAKGDAAIRGSASDILLALWQRPVSDGALEIIGDESVAADWLSFGGV